jgi:Domain of unknown function (DUF4386)
MRTIKNPGRYAGLWYVVTSIFGFFAMGYVPSKLIVHGDAGATANNIAASEMLFRLGIASQLIGMAGFIFVALAPTSSQYSKSLNAKLSLCCFSICMAEDWFSANYFGVSGFFR